MLNYLGVIDNLNDSIPSDTNLEKIDSSYLRWSSKCNSSPPWKKLDEIKPLPLQVQLVQIF